MADYAVVFTPRADRQLADLYAFIADHGSEARAERFIGALMADCQSLSKFPERGRPRDDIRPNLRTKSHAGRAVIAFSVDSLANTVVIHGVFYGGQDFERHLSETET